MQQCLQFITIECSSIRFKHENSRTEKYCKWKTNKMFSKNENCIETICKIHWLRRHWRCFQFMVRGSPKQRDKLVMKMDKLFQKIPHTKKTFARRNVKLKIMCKKLCNLQHWSVFSLIALHYAYPRHRFSNRAFHEGSIYIDSYRCDLITLPSGKRRVFQLVCERFFFLKFMLIN